MTEFKVGDKVRVKEVLDGGIPADLKDMEGEVTWIGPDLPYPVNAKIGGREFAFMGPEELELIAPAAREEKDVWEWLVEQSYLSEHDGKQAKAEYEGLTTGVDALPNEVGWYESAMYLLRDGYNPYRLEWGTWYQMIDGGLEEISHEEALEFMPLTKLGAEPGEEQA